jgi:hypothetical protein
MPGVLAVLYVWRSSSTPLSCSRQSSGSNSNRRLAIVTDEKNAPYFKALATMFQGCLLAATGKALNTIRLMAPTITSVQSTGSTLWVPFIYHP